MSNKVLLVDDSAHDPLIAPDGIARLDPDVLTLVEYAAVLDAARAMGSTATYKAIEV